MVIEVVSGCAVEFPEDFDERSMTEMTDRGYVNGAIVVTPAGRHRVFFIGPVRLQQELDDLQRMGTHFFAEPGFSGVG
jgi:hypothetical protein